MSIHSSIPSSFPLLRMRSQKAFKLLKQFITAMERTMLPSMGDLTVVQSTFNHGCFIRELSD